MFSQLHYFGAIAVLHQGKKTGLKWAGFDKPSRVTLEDQRSPLEATSPWIFQLTLDAVIHVELDRVRSLVECFNFLTLQVDIGINHIVREHATSSQKRSIFI